MISTGGSGAAEPPDLLSGPSAAASLARRRRLERRHRQWQWLIGLSVMVAVIGAAALIYRWQTASSAVTREVDAVAGAVGVEPRYSGTISRSLADLDRCDGVDSSDRVLRQRSAFVRYGSVDPDTARDRILEHYEGSGANVRLFEQDYDGSVAYYISILDVSRKLVVTVHVFHEGGLDIKATSDGCGVGGYSQTPVWPYRELPTGG
jgi:hypothetical protein